MVVRIVESYPRRGALARGGGLLTCSHLGVAVFKLTHGLGGLGDVGWLVVLEDRLEFDCTAHAYSLVSHKVVHLGLLVGVLLRGRVVALVSEHFGVGRLLDACLLLLLGGNLARLRLAWRLRWQSEVKLARLNLFVRVQT